MSRRKNRRQRGYGRDSEVDLKKSEKSSVRRVFTGLLILIVFALVLVVLGGGYYIYTSLQPLDENNNQTQQIVIPEGASISKISKILEDEGIVENAQIFQYYTRFSNYSNFQAGTYNFSPSMSASEIAGSLESGLTSRDEGTIIFTVKEGQTIDQVSQAIANQTEFLSEDFLKLMNDEKFLADLQNQFPDILGETIGNEDVLYPLEGYLFPATYDIGPKQNLETTIVNMVAKTNEVIQPYLTEIEASDYSVKEVMTMASLIEREGVTKEDRRKIAGVFYNRLEIDMPIQSDITVLYALGEHKEFVTYNDLEVDSPYNLYQYTGLGPGPFNNPSEEAIIAAIEPEDNNYIYFLADIRDGKVYYAEDYDEHLKLKEKYVDSLMPGADGTSIEKNNSADSAQPN